jgi:hypothetical protein
MPTSRWSVTLAGELQNIGLFELTEWVDFVWVCNNIFDWTERKFISYLFSEILGLNKA